SMNRWLETSSRAKSLLKNANFEAEDDYTVLLTLDEATSDVLIIMATKAQFPAIMPVEVIEEAEAEGVQEYIGTGPYQLEEWKQDQYIHLVNYENYQPVEEEPSGLAGKKEALVDNVYYHFVTDHATRISGLQAGQYDVADSIPLENYEQINDDENIEFYAYDGGALTAFYNTNEGILANEDIREAITTGLDMEAILVASFVHENLYSLDPGYMNPSQEQWQTDAGSEIYQANDIEKAKQLLDDAGYNGEEVTLLTTKDYGEMYNATLVIQEQLRQMDMNVDVEVYDFPTFMDRKEDPNNWDLFVASTGYQLTPPQILAVTPDWAGFEHPQATELLSDIRLAESSDEAKEKWEELQQFMYEHLPSTVLGHYKSLVASTKNVEGFTVFEAPIVWNTKVTQ
ncbi:MAG TPA: ABC transporter substrate-binding protein, partial [Bacillota bacterium]|nr:ABC transporter substrate-binding protein [Bacillota bacterium]